MPTNQNSVSSNTRYDSRDEAIAYLDSRENWSIGMFCTVLYTSGNDNQGDVDVLVAVGVKDSSECGPAGEPSADDWQNKYYPDKVCGREFYKIMYDSGETTPSGDTGSDVTLYTTNINMGGTSYEVSNEDGDQNVTDPLQFLNLNENE